MAEFDRTPTDLAEQKPEASDDAALPMPQPLAVPASALSQEAVVGPVISAEAARPGSRLRLSLEHQNTLTTLGLQLLLIILMFVNTHYSARAHQISWPVPTTEQIAAYNFIGVTVSSQ